MPVDPRKLTRTPIHRKVMRFFYENEGSVDTPRGISAWIGEPVAAVRGVLEELSESGALKAHRTSSTVGYSCPVGRKALKKASGPGV